MYRCNNAGGHVQLNLPILDQVANSQNILIAGAGGGSDVLCGLPIYFALQQMGKIVHLANYSFTEFRLAQFVSEPIIGIEDALLGARGTIKEAINYYPEGYLAQWFHEVRGETTPVWMFARTSVKPLITAYCALVKQFSIDAVILIDGGVDSLMRGNENGAGSLLEDSISLAAVSALDVPVKILSCIGFGTEVEDGVCHGLALENMAALAKQKAFWGSCALTPQMPVFQQFESACRYIWEQPKHFKSHISTRVIPAVNGEFGDFHMYLDHNSATGIYVTPLMSLYWFFDAQAVAEQNLLVKPLMSTETIDEARKVSSDVRDSVKRRPRQLIPY
jgi:hypothetical protein